MKFNTSYTVTIHLEEHFLLKLPCNRLGKHSVKRGSVLTKQEHYMKDYIVQSVLKQDKIVKVTATLEAFRDTKLLHVICTAMEKIQQDELSISLEACLQFHSTVQRRTIQSCISHKPVPILRQAQTVFRYFFCRL